MTLNLVKYPASGNGDSSTQPFASNGPPGIFPSSSSTSYVPPKFESDSIHSLLSRLTATIDKERQEHIMKINNLQSAVKELANTKAKLRDAQKAKKVAYNNIVVINKAMQAERRKKLTGSQGNVNVIEIPDDGEDI